MKDTDNVCRQKIYKSIHLSEGKFNQGEGRQTANQTAEHTPPRTTRHTTSEAVSTKGKGPVCQSHSEF